MTYYKNQLTPFEELVLEAATAYRKYLASQIPDPTMRLAAFGAAALHQYHLRQILIKEKNVQGSLN